LEYVNFYLGIFSINLENFLSTLANAKFTSCRPIGFRVKFSNHRLIILAKTKTNSCEPGHPMKACLCHKSLQIGSDQIVLTAIRRFRTIGHRLSLITQVGRGAGKIKLKSGQEFELFSAVWQSQQPSRKLKTVVLWKVKCVVSWMLYGLHKNDILICYFFFYFIKVRKYLVFYRQKIFVWDIHYDFRVILFMLMISLSSLWQYI